jgi:hypothetical protein
MRRHISGLRAASCTFARPTSAGSRLAIAWAVLRWWIWFFFICGHTAYRDVTPRLNMWMLLLQWAEFSWVAVKRAYLCPPAANAAANHRAGGGRRD